MASPPAAPPCGTHGRRPSVAGCTVCGARVCADCLVHTAVGIKCRTCTTAPRKRGARQPRGAAGRAGTRSRRLGAVALVVGLATVAGVGVSLLGGGEPEETGAATAEGHRESVVSFDSADGLTLHGTLLVPQDVSEPVPGAVVIPGFGPTNRDGVAPPEGPPDLLYHDLSETLADAGIASLRYDKRGTGQSPLDADQARDFADMVDDLAAALTFLGERVEVDAEALAVVGHDEGGLTALRMASSEAPFAALVLVSTPGRPLVEVLADDLVASSEEPGVGEAHAEELRAVVAELLASGELPDPHDLRPALRPVFPPGEDEYLEAIFALDPVEEAADVAVPALIVRGGRDPGVSAEDSAALASALGGDAEVLVGARSGHTLAIDDAAGHEMGTDDDSGGADPDRVASGTTRDDALLEEIASWLAATLRSTAAETR